MKKHNYLFILFFAVLACNSESTEEQQGAENERHASSFVQVVGIGKIIPEADIVQLSSAVSGIVQIIYKHENDTLTKGTIILELDHQLEDEKITLLGHQITTQAAQVKADEANVRELAAKINLAESEGQRLQNLVAKGAETQQTVDNATANLKALKANSEKLKANVAVAISKGQESKSALKTAALERDQKIIRSPCNGRLLEISVLIGGAVSLQQSFAQISPEGKTVAVCEIDEANAANITVGQKGWIRNVGSSDTLSTGTVYFALSFLKKKSLFTDQSGEKEDRRVRTIKILLDHPENLLLNKRVECVIAISNNLKK